MARFVLILTILLFCTPLADCGLKDTIEKVANGAYNGIKATEDKIEMQVAKSIQDSGLQDLGKKVVDSASKGLEEADGYYHSAKDQYEAARFQHKVDTLTRQIEDYLNSPDFTTLVEWVISVLCVLICIWIISCFFETLVTCLHEIVKAGGETAKKAARRIPVRVQGGQADNENLLALV